MQHSEIHRGIRPPPKPVVSLAVQPQQVTRLTNRLADAQRQRLRAHAVLDRQRTGLKLIAYRTVAYLCCVWRNGFRLFRELQIGVTRLVGTYHGHV